MSEPAPKPLQVYRGQDVTVTYDPNVCAHAGECVRGLPAVFDAKQKPWIDPDAGDAAAVRRQVEHCPSGALQHYPPGEEPAASG